MTIEEKEMSKTSQGGFDKPPTVAYEWILTMNKGDDVMLTENQYAFYKENYKESKIFFSDFEINPAYVVQSTKRRATAWLKSKYPCDICHTGGRKVGNTGWCEVCGGSGVILPKNL